MTKLKKGSSAFAVNISANAGVGSVYVLSLDIQSMGKKQGTATDAKDDRKLHRQLYVGADAVRCGFGYVFATREEVEAYIAKEALSIAEQSRVGSLQCEESNFPNLWPKYREAAAARIAALKTMTPTFSVKWN